MLNVYKLYIDHFKEHIKTDDVYDFSDMKQPPRNQKPLKDKEDSTVMAKIQTKMNQYESDHFPAIIENQEELDRPLEDQEMLDAQLKLDRAFKKMQKDKQRFLQKLMNNVDIEHIDSSKMYFLK